MRLPDCLCLAGVALVTTALWMAHPALALGGFGSLLVIGGVVLHRQRGGPKA